MMATILLFESASGYKLLDVFAIHVYCNLWKLCVNKAKTKVVIFSKGPMTKRFFFCIMMFLKMRKNSINWVYSCQEVAGLIM